MKTHVPQALLRADPVTILRPSATSDTEGNPTGNRQAVNTVKRATWRELSAQEQLVAAERGTKMQREFVFTLGSDVQAGDWIKLSDATTWEAVDADNLRSHRRVLTRRVA